MIRAVDRWLAGYLRSVLRRPGRVQGPKHLMFCVADHFEPAGRSESKEEARGIVKCWVDEYPAVVDVFHDADGKCPQHTFFYPQEEYDEDCLDLLAGLCEQGYGEVEIHLHHRNDTPEGLRAKLVEFRDTLHEKHGLLGIWKSPLLQHSTTPTLHSSTPAFGFVHGNWALCNSRPDGDWCGVNEELGILRETGCYADFTFPSAPSSTQPRMVNAIYYARDIPGRARSHDYGRLVRLRNLNHGGTETQRSLRQGYALPRKKEKKRVLPNSEFPAEITNLAKGSSWEEEERESDTLHPPSRLRQPQGYGEAGDSRFTLHGARDALMLIQGPLGLDWKRRKWGILPRLENGEISGINPPTPDRIDLWVKQHIHVVDRPEWVFVKVHTHGCVEENVDIFLSRVQNSTSNAQRPTPNAQLAFHEYLQEKYNDGKEWVLHYVTAREMYNIVRAAEDGMMGEPGKYRDYEISAPVFARGQQS